MTAYDRGMQMRIRDGSGYPSLHHRWSVVNRVVRVGDAIADGARGTRKRDPASTTERHEGTMISYAVEHDDKGNVIAITLRIDNNRTTIRITPPTIAIYAPPDMNFGIRAAGAGSFYLDLPSEKTK